jgi:hypothetical protein
MFSAFRNRFGIPGVISVIALVFAMFGGAYAASDDNSAGKASASKASASATAKKGPRGPKGAKGATGPAGPQGPAGPKGDAGAPGSNGTNGTNGTDGDDGISVTSQPFNGTLEGKCAGQGGSKFVAVNGSTFACNGEDGSPWAVGGSVPAGETLVGTWAAGRGGSGNPAQTAPISFPLPLDSAPDLVFVWMTEGPFATPFTEEELDQLLEEADENGCPGFDEGLPLADPGKLCVYGNFLEQMSPTGTGLTPTKRPPGEAKQIFLNVGQMPPPSGSGAPVVGVGPAGTTLRLNCEASNCEAIGTWAVTAE